MLVLSRKTNERILIGDNVTVTIVRVRGDVVRLGIEAPNHMRVLRSELLGRDPAELDSPKTTGQPSQGGGDEGT
jgi:carbon storage regulator